MNADGLVVVYASVPQATTWDAMPGVFYLADCSSGNLVFQLPSALSVPVGSYLACKIVGGSGVHQALFKPWPGEFINGLSEGVAIVQAGQGRGFTAGAPDGPAAGRGWMSQ